MKIKELGRIIRCRIPPADDEEYWNGDIPLITTKELQSGKYIRSSERHLTQKGLQLHPKHIIPSNAVCVSCVGNLGYVSITTETCLANPQILTIVPNEDNDFEYIYYLMKSMWGFFKQIEGHSTVTSHINKDRFSDIEISIPTLSEQRKIAANISPFDEFLEVNNRKCDNLREQLKLIFCHYTLRSAETAKFSDFCNVKCGNAELNHGNEDYFGGNIPLLRIQDVTDVFTTNTGVTITENAVIKNNMKKSLFPAGTIVLTTVGTIGKVSIITKPMCITGSIAVITPNDPKMTEYIYAFLLSQYDYLHRISTGSIMKSVKMEKLKNIDVPVIPNEKIEFIINVIHPIFEQLQQIHKENIITTKMRDMAIAKLFERTKL